MDDHHCACCSRCFPVQSSHCLSSSHSGLRPTTHTSGLSKSRSTLRASSSAALSRSCTKSIMTSTGCRKCVYLQKHTARSQLRILRLAPADKSLTQFKCHNSRYRVEPSTSQEARRAAEMMAARNMTLGQKDRVTPPRWQTPTAGCFSRRT